MKLFRIDAALDHLTKQHRILGFNRDVAHKVLNMDSDIAAVVVIAIGVQDSHEKLSGPLQERELAPRSRLPLNEIVVKGLPN